MPTYQNYHKCLWIILDIVFSNFEILKFKTFLMTHKYKLVIAVTKRATASLEIVAPHNGSSPPLSVRTNGHRCLRQEKLEGFNLEGTLLLGSSIHIFVIVVVLQIYSSLSKFCHGSRVLLKLGFYFHICVV